MARAVVVVFPDYASAEQAIVELKAAGFDPGHMGFVMRDREQARQAASDVGVATGPRRAASSARRSAPSWPRSALS